MIQTMLTWLKPSASVMKRMAKNERDSQQVGLRGWAEIPMGDETYVE
jgi:hypothetical protein